MDGTFVRGRTRPAVQPVACTSEAAAAHREWRARKKKQGQMDNVERGMTNEAGLSQLVSSMAKEKSESITTQGEDFLRLIDRSMSLSSI